MFGKRDRAAVSEAIHGAQGGTMSSEDKGTDTTIVVGASGSVGILPDGFFAKILSDPGPEPRRSDSTRSEAPQDGR